MPESRKRSAVARHASAVRWNKPNQKDTARDLAAEQLSEYIARIVAEAPPLTPDQRARIAALLAPTEGASK